MHATLDHDAFRTAAEIGEIAVDVEPAIARRFLTSGEYADFRALVREPLKLERFVVNASLILAPVILLTSFWFAWSAFGRWSMIVVPITALLWFIQHGAASVGRPALWFLLLIVGLLLFRDLGQNPSPTYLWLTAFLGAALMSRITYRCASSFLRLLVIRNPEAYSLFLGSGVFVRKCK
jgi:hypothetical protein